MQPRFDVATKQLDIHAAVRPFERPAFKHLKRSNMHMRIGGLEEQKGIVELTQSVVVRAGHNKNAPADKLNPDSPGLYLWFSRRPPRPQPLFRGDEALVQTGRLPPHAGPSVGLLFRLVPWLLIAPVLIFQSELFAVLVQHLILRIKAWLPLA